MLWNLKLFRILIAVNLFIAPIPVWEVQVTEDLTVWGIELILLRIP